MKLYILYLTVVVIFGALPIISAEEFVSIPAGTSVPGCEQSNTCYFPHEITISAGERVTWLNEDTAAHTVTSGTSADGPDGVFASSLFMTGAEFSWVFEEAGTYNYFCMVHPWMEGIIVVQASSSEPAQKRTNFSQEQIDYIMGYVDNIKLLLEQAKKEYSKGNADVAYNLATRAYIDNFEFLEWELEQNGRLTTEYMLLQEAHNRGFWASEQEAVSSLKQQIKQSRMTLDQFKQRLHAQGTTFEDTVSHYQDQLVTDKLYEQLSQNEISALEYKIEQSLIKNKNTIDEIEWMLREELPSMIKNQDPAGDVDSKINEIFVSMNRIIPGCNPDVPSTDDNCIEISDDSNRQQEFSSLREEPELQKPQAPTDDTPPIVFAGAKTAMVKPELTGIEALVWLSPAGWSHPAGIPLEVDAIGIDATDGFLNNVSIQYSINSNTWIDAPTDVRSESISDVFGPSDMIPNQEVTVPVFDAKIPAQDSGDTVRFRAVAADSSGNESVSPFGFYYVTNTSKPPILIVDPHVDSWYILQNSKEIVKTIESNGILLNDSSDSLSKKIDTIEPLTSFRSWQKIADDYSIKIVSPGDISSDTLEQHNPEVIILSSLYPGIKQKSQENNPNLVNYDLADHDKVGIIIDYIQDTNAGVLATHGTLSDMVIWSDCSPTIKVGTRGHIGERFSDVLLVSDPLGTSGLSSVRENTISAILGMPHLAAYEDVKDQLARSMCSTNAAYANVVGSIPFHMPGIPYSGNMHATDQTSDTGLDIPSTFSIKTPSPLFDESLGESYTQIGWQLAVPLQIDESGMAWMDGNDPVSSNTPEAIGDIAESLGHDVSRLESESLGWAMESFFSEIGSDISSGNQEISGLFDIGGQKYPVFIENTYSDLINSDYTPRLVALSDDKRAGIVSYDKSWTPNGHRAIYMSIEPEASSSQDDSERILTGSIEWLRDWKYEEPAPVRPETTPENKQILSEDTQESGFCFLLWCF